MLVHKFLKPNFAVNLFFILGLVAKHAQEQTLNLASFRRGWECITKPYRTGRGPGGDKGGTGTTKFHVVKQKGMFSKLHDMEGQGT